MILFIYLFLMESQCYFWHYKAFWVGGLCQTSREKYPSRQQLGNVKVKNKQTNKKCSFF